MTVIADLVAQWRDGKIDGLGLMRGLIGYGEWQVPISERALAQALGGNALPALQLTSDKEGKTCLLLFSSAPAYQRYGDANADHSTPPQHFVTLPGSTLFGASLETVDRICIDPFSPQDIFYDKPQFGRLREYAGAILVEEALTGLRHGQAKDGAVAVVRDYRAYSLAVVERDGSPRLLMAPDQKGRALAAIFTAADAYDAFMPDAKAAAGGGEVREMIYEGRALFEALQGMRLDGLVFNCSGPVAPIAFAPGFAKVVIEG
jgi:SseB protein N-terminal domain